MMNKKEREAVKKWYSQGWILEAVRKSCEQEAWDDLEANVQRIALIPLSKHDNLPDYMRTPEGKPLFTSNLSPMSNEEEWQDAVEIGWEVVREKLGISEIEVRKKLQDEIDADWEVFMKSVEERKKKRSDTPD
jgi:hypothetical protein